MAKKESKKDITVSKEDKRLKKTTSATLWDPFDEMEREMDHMFGRFGRGWMRPHRWGGPFWREMNRDFEGMVPSVDVIERDAEVVVRAELPGVERKDLDVSLSGSLLTIKGITKTEHEEEKGEYFRKEVSSGSFSRAVRLPAEVDGEHVKSGFKDGILELTLPKLQKAKRQRITVE